MASPYITKEQTVRLKEALGELKANPQPSLIYVNSLLDIAVFGPPAEEKEGEEEANEEEENAEGDKAEEEEEKPAEEVKVVIPEGAVNVFEFLVEEGNTRLVEDILSIFEAPYVEGSKEDVYFSREPLNLASTTFGRLIEYAPGGKFVSLLAEHNYFPRVIMTMHKKWPQGNNQRVQVASALRDLPVNQPFIDALTVHFEKEDPLQSVAAIEMLMSLCWGTTMPYMLVKAGAIDCTMRSFALLANAEYRQVDHTIDAFNKFLGIPTDADAAAAAEATPAEDEEADAEENEETGAEENKDEEAEDEKAEKEEAKSETGADKEPVDPLAEFTLSTIREKLLVPSNLRTIFEAALDTSNKNGLELIVRLAGQLLSYDKLKDANELFQEVARARVTALKASSPNYSLEQFVSAIRAFLEHDRIEDEVKHILARTEGVADFLVNLLGSLPPSLDQPPFTAAHMVAQSLTCIVWSTVEPIFRDAQKLKPLLATCLRIADYFPQQSDPRVPPSWVKQDAFGRKKTFGSPTLVLRISRTISADDAEDESPGMAEIGKHTKEYFTELFAAPEPPFGGGGAFHRTLDNMYNDAQMFFNSAGVVSYFFKVMRKYEVGSDVWENASLALKAFAKEGGDVDLLKEEDGVNRLEIVKKALATPVVVPVEGGGDRADYVRVSQALHHEKINLARERPLEDPALGFQGGKRELGRSHRVSQASRAPKLSFRTHRDVLAVWEASVVVIRSLGGRVISISVTRNSRDRHVQ